MVYVTTYTSTSTKISPSSHIDMRINNEVSTK